MKIKKLLVIVLIILGITLTGCAKVEYSRTISENGVIIDAISVTLNENDINNAGLNFETVKQNIVRKMNNYMSAIINNFDTRNDNLSLLEKINVRQNMANQVYSKDNYVIGFFKFNNYTTFKYFYGLHLLEDEDDQTEISEGFLYNKNISAGKTIFSGEDARYIENDFLNYFNGKFTLDDVQYEYMFGTYDDKMYSDADKEFCEDGINYHVWTINTDNVDREIQTFYLQIKPINWYLLALTITAIFITISFAYVFINKRIKKIISK